jgi:hypothetical protein
VAGAGASPRGFGFAARWRAARAGPGGRRRGGPGRRGRAAVLPCASLAHAGLLAAVPLYRGGLSGAGRDQLAPGPAPVGKRSLPDGRRHRRLNLFFCGGGGGTGFWSRRSPHGPADFVGAQRCRTRHLCLADAENRRGLAGLSRRLLLRRRHRRHPHSPAARLGRLFRAGQLRCDSGRGALPAGHRPGCGAAPFGPAAQ